jgi:hypothetical protein
MTPSTAPSRPVPNWLTAGADVRFLARAASLVGAAALTAGCTSMISGQAVVPDVERADRALIVEYFERGNAAAGEGSHAQQRFFVDTQHPDFESGGCDLGGLTLAFDPTLSTLQVDRRWAPRNSKVPRGRVYVVAVTLTVQRESTVLGTQIGLVHLVALDGAIYGFTPCPN